MKKLLLVLIAFTTISSTYSQRPWQQQSKPTAAEVFQNFQSPPPENSLLLWWGWDGPMNDTVIRRDLDRIKSFGFNAVMIEAGYGMTQKYLSDGWFKLVRTAVLEAKKRNMRVWVEDEGKYPSGFAGGKFSELRPELCMQALMPNEPIDVRPGEPFSKKLSENTISAVAINADNDSIVPLTITNGEIAWNVPFGRWEIQTASYQFRSSKTRSVNNPTKGKDESASLFDYLNPEATRQFIEWTHEQYRKNFGDEFGKTFMGIMGDEPDFAFTPWTPTMLEKFKAIKGYDVQPWLASFFLSKTNEKLTRIKADYFDVWSTLFAENFFDVQANWCRSNGIEYIVHLNHEEMALGLVKSEGDYFKNMRNVGVPGVDAIWSQIWMDHVADYPKLASSAAHVFGHPRAFTESFAAYTYKPSVAQAKWVIDYQLVRGINLVQIMFMPSSANRKAEPDTAKPKRQSFFTNDSFPAVASYINRSSYLLSQGRPSAQIAVYYPTTSFWMNSRDADRSTLDIARQLSEMQYDYDFIDEQAITDVLKPGQAGTLVNLSGQAYNTVIIPSISAISEKGLQNLLNFAKDGGKLIFMGQLPRMINNKTFLDAKELTELPQAMREPSGEFTPRIRQNMPMPDVSIHRATSSVKYIHRKLADAEVYFFFNEKAENISTNVSLAGSGNAELWDAMSGKAKPISAIKPERSGYVTVPLELNSWETKIIVIR